MKIKKGDNIIVMTGKDKGKTGKVSKVFPKQNSVLVPGINIKKKHQKPRSTNQKGQIIDIPTPIDASNVSLETKIKKSK
ncbi:MAG: 50S ribosomal protein L24 [bacterium]